MASYDAIIIGGGHNGLTSAAYLAKAGKKVLVLERRHVLGGAAVTEEIYPGFKYSVCSYVVSLLRPEVIRDLENGASVGEDLRRMRDEVGELRTLATALRSRVFWGLVQVFFFTASAMFAIIVQLVAFLVDAGFSPLTAASAFGVVGLLSGISVMASGLSSDRFGYRQTISLSFAGTASGMALLFAMTFEPSAVLLVLFVPLFGLCMGMRGPIVSSVAARYFAGARVATIYGLIYASNAVGAALGAFAGGLLHDLTGGYRAALALSLVLITVAALPFWTVPALRNFR